MRKNINREFLPTANIIMERKMLITALKHTIFTCLCSLATTEDTHIVLFIGVMAMFVCDYESPLY